MIKKYFEYQKRKKSEFLAYGELRNRINTLESMAARLHGPTITSCCIENSESCKI